MHQEREAKTEDDDHDSLIGGTQARLLPPYKIWLQQQAHDGACTIQVPCPVQVLAPSSTPSTVAPSTAINTPAAPTNISEASAPPTVVASPLGVDGQVLVSNNEPSGKGDGSPAHLNHEIENSKG